MTDRSKIVERLRKLLAMAEDASSPNEAAIAARRAKALMDEYNLTHADALTSGLSLDDILHQTAGEAHRRFPEWLSSLAVAVAEYSDCTAVFDWAVKNGQERKIVAFRGERSDLEIAKYLYVFLDRTIRNMTKARRDLKGRTAMHSFRVGMASAIGAKLREMKAQERAWFEQNPDSKALVLVNKKAALLREKFGAAKYRAARSAARDAGAFFAGKAAGRNVNVRRGVGGATNTRALARD